MDDLKTIIGGLCKSDYLPEWILELKDNEILFSPKRNIKPCIKVDESHVRTDIWQGLVLLETYCRRGFNNKEVDDFIVSLVNESISLYEHDTETDPYAKLNSSHGILQGLLDIVLQRVDLINGVNFVSLTNIILDSVLFWPFSLVYGFFENKESLLGAIPVVVFEAYRNIIEYRKKKADYDNYLVVPELVLKNPLKYYLYSREVISKFDSDFYDMGSFYEYDKSYTNETKIAYFNWLKISSKGTDDRVLKDDIISFINSENELLNKIGLCLININFDRLSSLFLDNGDLFFNNENFYADLRCLIGNLSPEFVKNNVDTISEFLKKATFGVDNLENVQTLKNHLYGILNKKGADFPYSSESEGILIKVRNFNKKVYVIDHDPSSDVDILVKRIGDKNIDEAVSFYKEIIGGSHYFDDVVHRAFCRYLVKNYPNNCASFIDRFGYRFSISFINYVSYDKEGKNNSHLIAALKRVVDMMLSDDSFRGALSVVMYSLRTVSDSMEISEFAALFERIDYKWLSISEYDNCDNIITTCINEILHSYFEIGLWLCENEKYNVKKIEKAIEYFRENYDCQKLKSVLAFVYPRLLATDNEFADSYENYIFSNIQDDKNLSYPLLSISKHCSDKLLSIISKRSDFLEYFRDNPNNHDLEMSQKIIGSWFLRTYVANGFFEEIVKSVFAYDKYDVILENIRTMDYWLRNNQLNEEQINRCKEYMSWFNVSYNSKISSYNEIDQLIRVLSDFLVITHCSNDYAWELLFKLFSHFRHFFSDESIELVKRFKNTQIEKIIQLLDLYFHKYDRYQTYETTLLEVFNLINDDIVYKDKAREWRAFLVNENIDLKDKLVLSY